MTRISPGWKRYGCCGRFCMIRRRPAGSVGTLPVSTVGSYASKHTERWCSRIKHGHYEVSCALFCGRTYSSPEVVVSEVKPPSLTSLHLKTSRADGALQRPSAFLPPSSLHSPTLLGDFGRPERPPLMKHRKPLSPTLCEASHSLVYCIIGTTMDRPRSECGGPPAVHLVGACEMSHG